MTLIEKSIFVIAIGGCVFLWNRYAVRLLIKKFVKLNAQNLWLERNQTTIIKGIQLFYWLFYLMFVLAILVSK